jgi:hypothetical protein
MKTRGFLSTLFAIMVLCALQLTISTAPAASNKYSAQLISPVAGQVLYAGQRIMVEWKHTLPNIPLPGCESEAWLSLDGGSTFTVWITWLAPRSTSFLWTVPNTPTNAAVLDIRFGCDLHYPESYAPQPASMFVIAPSPGQ